MSGPPGLASYRQSSTTSEGVSEAPGDAPAEPDVEPGGTGCPARAGMVFLNLETGETRPARCGRNACGYCLAANARRRGLAIAYARPQRELRLSLVADAGDPDPWQTARTRINRTMEYMRRWKEPIGLIGYHVELNPEQTGYHAHAIQHGPKKINKDALDQAAFRAGAGLTRVRKVQHVDGLAEYGLKGAALAAYGLKGALEGAEYLRLNGGRLGHYSRGFFRGEDGGSLPVRRAEALALKALYGEQEHGSWTLMTARGAKSWASLRPAAGPASVTLPSGTALAG